MLAELQLLNMQEEIFQYVMHNDTQIPFCVIFGVHSWTET